MTTVLASISYLMVAAVFLPQVRSDYWVFKVFEYPRLQKLIVIAIMILAWMVVSPFNELPMSLGFVLLCVAAGYLVYKIFPYTVLSSKEMKSIAIADETRTLQLYTCNVLQDNTRYDRLLTQIKANDPDIVFLMETNKAWEQAVSVIEKDYPYTLKEPLENTYGLLLFSKLPLEDASVKYLVKDDIPSVEANVVLRNGARIKLFGLHPEPPLPGESLYATAKDKELMKIALKVRDCNMPCIVFGDFNDVAWSHTTELFRKTSELLDPRRGRGFYSTFSAFNWFFRFPLDYVFCSCHFGLVSMKRMPKNGSDHFATCIRLALAPEKQHEHDTPEADHEELQEAKEKASTLIEKDQTG
jgi:endonuclease/exonuclease/phosphatase (EEP) superfamily protein YafD